jgi:hypothetical protein
MACPFCSIMLKGARASSNAQIEMTDLMSYVAGALPKTTSSAVSRDDEQ